MVIDEIVEFFTANFIARQTIGRWSWGLFCLRFFNVAKIFTIEMLEALPGGTGIVLDDVVAGLYTFAVVHLITGWNLL
ncbi:MAG: phosphatidylglycerophosphatase A [Deltaproteobacteria bacterium]